MNENASSTERQQLIEAQGKGLGSRLGLYAKLSGPGWLQSAVTLGGGSLSASLYLGVCAGADLLWVQPLAMLVGIIMLGAISYVTLSTGRAAFPMINQQVNPVLGWGWILATLAANLVFVMPQFTLTVAAVQQNLLPGPLGPVTNVGGKVIILIAMAAICVPIVWSYGGSGRGVKIFEWVLKAMVALIIVSFVGVVIKIAGTLEWGSIFRGFVPSFSLLHHPAEAYLPHLEQVDPQFRAFWTDLIIRWQRELIISSAAIVVGINMTFLMPYSLLRRGWGREHRGLALFDRFTGMLSPFVLVAACIVVAAGTQFHGKPAQGLLNPADPESVQPSAALKRDYLRLTNLRLKQELGASEFSALGAEAVNARRDALPEADRALASMLAKPDAFDLARSLTPLTGSVLANIVFGIGVVGMGISSAIIIMMINGFVLCEILGRPWTGWTYRVGTLLPLATGSLMPFLWSNAFSMFLPTSIFGMTILPIAYLTFLVLMNHRRLLGDALPRGSKRWLWNTLMAASLVLVFGASLWTIHFKAGTRGLAAFGVFAAAVVAVQLARRNR